MYSGFDDGSPAILPSLIITLPFTQPNLKTGLLTRALCVLLTCHCLHQASHAEDTVLGREDAIVQALRKNPDLRVAALEIEVAHARLRWAGLLPNPELEITASDDFPGEAAGERTLEIGFTQRFPAASALRNARQLRRQQVQIAGFEYASHQRRLAHEVDTAWIELAMASRSTTLLRDLLELNRGITAFLEKREAVGETSRIEVAQARLKGKLLAQQIADARAQERAAALNLRQLAGLPLDTLPRADPTMDLPSDPPVKSVDLQQVLASRPDYQALLLELPAAETRLALAKARNREEISLSIFYEAERSIDEPEGPGTNHFGGLGISIPLPLRKSNGGELAAAEIAINRAKTMREALAYTIGSEVDSALEARFNAHRLASDARGELLADARGLLEETTAAHRSGLASFLQVQQAQAQLLELETGAVRLLEDYLLADARVRLVCADYPTALPETPPSPRASQP